MGIFGTSDEELQKEYEELSNEFFTQGFSCKATIGSSGRSGASRAGATLVFGLAGFAASSGKVEEKADGRLYMKKKGLRFIPKHQKYIEIRLPWEDIIHAGADVNENGLYIYTDNDANIIFRLNSYKKRHFVVKIVEETCILLKNDLDGWE